MAAAPGLEEQRKDIGAYQERAPQGEGESWFLIDGRWMQRWMEYVESGGHNIAPPPGPIDNSRLLQDPETQTLKANLIENEDYVLLHSAVWSKLDRWYGQVQGQQPIERRVICLSSLTVEVYRLELALCHYSNMDELITVSFSRADTVDILHKEARRVFEVPAVEETRLWARNADGSYERLRNPQAILNTMCLCSGQVILVESRSEDGTWPTVTLHLTRNSLDNQSSYYQGQPGVCGLSNLGNTCFMNSAVQCLSSIAPLTEYFLSNAYLPELNVDNPLGMQGEIAEAYADIIKQMWSGRHYTVVPRMFKTRVGHFAPQFSGYQPHDSQELLAFLLDGLHEDLNRVRRKEYVELKDAAGRDDVVVASEAWTNHHRRNDSIIVDIFHGLFKSTLVCPQCSKVSVTFDPFCYLSVPLPVSAERVLEVFLVPMDPRSKPIQHRVVVPKAGKIWDLYLALSKLSGIAPDKLVAADIFNHRFYKLFQSDDLLSTILDRDDIFIFEVTNNMEDEDANDDVMLSVYFREKVAYRGYSMSTYMFGHPLLVSVPRDQLNWEALYQLLLHRLSRYVSHPTSDDEHEDDDNVEEEEADEEQNNYTQQTNGLAEGAEGENSTSPHPASHPNSSPGQENTEEEPSAVSGDGLVSVESEEGSREAAESAEGSSTSLGKRPLRKQKWRTSPRHIFTFQRVNANGVTERGTPECSQNKNGRTQMYVALDWDSDMRKRYYDELEAEKYMKDHSMGTAPKKVTVSLKECIDLFTSRETLEEENPWYCPVCKEHQLATKKFDLWALPEVLIIHLKRFSYTRLWKEKLDTTVEFPLRDLDLSEFLINPKAKHSKYDLIAVSNHYGSLRDGHYTTIARNKDDGLWYYFDDSKVTFASAEHIVSSAAYVLFYQLQEKVPRRPGGSPEDGCPPSASGSSRQTESPPPGAGGEMEME